MPLPASRRPRSVSRSPSSSSRQNLSLVKELFDRKSLSWTGAFCREEIAAQHEPGQDSGIFLDKVSSKLLAFLE